MNSSFLRNWKRFLAWGMAKANEADEQEIELRDCQDYTTMAELKRALLGNLQGRVWEIGPGAGLNLSYCLGNQRQPNRADSLFSSQV